MLTPRENLIETVRGGNPDRYVNQFEALEIQWASPQDVRYPDAEYGGEPAKNCWGVTFVWPEGTPGPFPIHDDDHLVIKDVDHWRDYVKMPETDFPESEWEWIVAEAEKVDRTRQFVTATVWPGLFENCHHLMGMEEACMNLLLEPDTMHDLIKFIQEYELKLAEQIIDHIHPDALYRHDDWGSQISTFMSKEVFDEFYLEPTKQVYDYWRSRGVELIIHHSDSFAETFVPEMVEMGIDVWQGAMSTNDLPRIAREYAGKLTIMGGIDNGIVDRVDWTPEKVTAEVERVIDWVDSPYFIPNTTYGGPISAYEGVYEAVSEAIDRVNKKRFANSM